MTKPPKILICEKCDFSCGKKSDWERHILTSKHNLNHSTAIESKIRQTEFVCKKCNKSIILSNFKNSMGNRLHYVLSLYFDV